MKKIILFVAGLILCGGFSGCNTQWKSEFVRIPYNVKQVHSLPSQAESKTYCFLRGDQQEGDPQHSEYEQTIERLLGEYGWRRVESLADADYKIYFDYGISAARAVQTQVYVGRRGHNVGTSLYSNSLYSGNTLGGFYPNVGWVTAPKLGEYTFDRSFIFWVLDGKGMQKGDYKEVYRGIVECTGSSGNLSEIVPNMIHVLFQDFPGKSGKEEVYEFPVI